MSEKNGIVDGVYYEKDRPVHAGIVEIDGNMYYAGHNGVIVKDRKKSVHSAMANNKVKHGVYFFDADGRLQRDSYQKFKKYKRKLTTARKKKKISLIILLVLSVIFLAILVVIVIDRISNTSNDADGYSADDSANMQIILPEFKEPVALCSNSMQEYYQGKISLKSAFLAENAYRGFQFQYVLTGVDSAELYLNGTHYDLDLVSNCLTVDNLLTGTRYDYTVVVTVNGDKQEYTGSFHTLDTNRLLYLPGVRNIRDIGGYTTSSGKTVKQGLLIRGSEIDGHAVSNLYLQDIKKAQEFGFVSEMDLRPAAVSEPIFHSRLGDDVKLFKYDAIDNEDLLSPDTLRSLKALFSDLAHEDNYPVYLHCTYGAEKTGTVVFLLQAALGIRDEDLDLEYCLSGSISYEYAEGAGLPFLYEFLEKMDGVTTEERTVSYLKNYVGVTDEELSAIRSIFLTD